MACGRLSRHDLVSNLPIYDVRQRLTAAVIMLNLRGLRMDEHRSISRTKLSERSPIE
jgi:hypothetical protein